MSWINKVEIGNKVRIDPLWNRTEPSHRQIDKVVEVLNIISKASSQTGVLFTVRMLGGSTVDLDASWFLPL